MLQCRRVRSKDGDGDPAWHGPSPCEEVDDEEGIERLARAVNDRGPRRLSLEERIDRAEEAVSYTHLTLPTICSV
eukprot:14196632-Alexandrium_andersonii.AAC.1